MGTVWWFIHSISFCPPPPPNNHANSKHDKEQECTDVVVVVLVACGVVLCVPVAAAAPEHQTAGSVECVLCVSVVVAGWLLATVTNSTITTTTSHCIISHW